MGSFALYWLFLSDWAMIIFKNSRYPYCKEGYDSVDNQYVLGMFGSNSANTITKSDIQTVCQKDLNTICTALRSGDEELQQFATEQLRIFDPEDQGLFERRLGRRR